MSKLPFSFLFSKIFRKIFPLYNRKIKLEVVK